MDEIAGLRTRVISLLEKEGEPLYSYGDVLINIGDYYLNVQPTRIDFNFTLELRDLLYILYNKSEISESYSRDIKQSILDVLGVCSSIASAIEANKIDAGFFKSFKLLGHALRDVGIHIKDFSNTSSDIIESNNSIIGPYAYQNSLEDRSSMDTNTLIAAISALIDAITLWRSARDRQESAKALQQEFDRVKSTSNREAIILGNLVPADLLDIMIDRVYACYKKYQQVLENDKEYLPDEIEDATHAVIFCVCRELNRIYELNQHIPPGKLSEWWEGYKCFTKLN
jgi:hypothetical protein